MALIPLATITGEALLLGLATGPVCLASCGPVLLPWMMVQPQGLRTHGRQLALFLAARLGGYLAFAVVAWSAGAAVPGNWASRPAAVGAIQLLLAIALVVYAAGWPRRRRGSAPALVQISARPPRTWGALTLGFLTGVSLCPPFWVAGVRAAQLASLSAALLFFATFFVGTALWFAPFVSLGWVRRTPAVLTVARMIAILLAAWYAISGIFLLAQGVVYG